MVMIDGFDYPEDPEYDAMLERMKDYTPVEWKEPEPVEIDLSEFGPEFFQEYAYWMYRLKALLVTPDMCRKIVYYDQWGCPRCRYEPVGPPPMPLNYMAKARLDKFMEKATLYRRYLATRPASPEQIATARRALEISGDVPVEAENAI